MANNTSAAYPYLPPYEAQFDEDRAQLFIITKLLRGVHTCELVKVLSVHPTSGKVGFVDVQPLILDVSTNNVVIAQSPIYNVPYTRYQGGSSAIILDPVANDIGLAIFAQRDITTIKQTVSQGPAATNRAHNSADALYIGGVLNPNPTQYIQFQPGAAGINLVSPGEITLQAGTTISITSGATTTISATNGLTINANVTLNGSINQTVTGSGTVVFAGTIVAPNAVINGVTQSTHRHTGVTTGASDTGGPSN